MNAAVATAGAMPRRAAPVAIAGARAAAFARGRLRMIVGAMLFIALIAVLALRLLDLSVLHAAPAGPGAGLNPALPVRGDLVDRNGVELARSFDAFAITYEPSVKPGQPVRPVGDPAEIARKLAAILPEADEARLRADLSVGRKFAYISRRVLPWQAKAINDIGEPSLHVRREPQRLYPGLDLGAHVIGYTSPPTKADPGFGVHGLGDRAIGRSGMEFAAEPMLTDPATRGTPVVLAMDVRVQQALESELAAGMAKHRAAGAAGIVMDVNTGEVVAMASLPTFNPNAPGKGWTVPEKDKPDVRYNRAVSGVYEPGSTFKALTIAMALDAGVITSMQQKFDATRPITVGGHTIHDHRGDELFRWATVPDIFIHSSNIGTARIAEALGGERQRAYLDKLGFFKPVQVELPGRGYPIFPAVSNWGESAVMTVGFGHGVSISPLHIATAYAALANGGILHPATMLRVAPGQAVPGTRVFSERGSDELRALFRLVVTNGTGRKANTPGYRVGGKTGTAEKVVNGRYVHNQLVSTFAGMFPMDAPRYVVLAMLDEPHGTADTGGFATAGQVSAPIIERLVARIGPMLGVQPDTTKDVDIRRVLGLTDELKADE